jgi:glycosyltransferase involved in cell wall biosynthesis
VKFGVSVYIPNRNHAATLPAAIYSAASQMPVEVAVIDDASTDDSVAVADAAAMTYDSVWLHRNTVKAPCWEQAAAEQFTFFGGSHIIGLSADDELHPGVVQSTMRHPNAAVIFHSYYCRKPGRDPHAAVPMPFHQVTAMTKAEACQHISSDALPCETGIGSAIRWNWLMWLCQYEYWRMGAWADAVGYSAVAAMGGCVYVPQAGAIFTEDDAGYGVTQRNSTDSGRYMVECWAFLKRAGVPQDVAAAICRKRGVDA